jgi:mannose-1-phosphate guanylyltransferase
MAGEEGSVAEIYAMIMAGGRGERFWPLSTAGHPKQVLRIFGDKSLLEMASGYLSGVVPPERTLIITSDALVGPLADGLPSLPRENVIGEPVGRDTAAAIALGAAIVAARDPEAVLCVLTADHIIGDTDIFRQTLVESADMAWKSDILVTIGISPTYPSTGYGYIEAGDPVEWVGETEFVRALRFVEKPDAAKARAYVESGRFCWNSGMFVWSIPSVRKALALHRPQLAGMIDRLLPVAGAPGFRSALEREYAGLEKISIDYALMEKAGNIVMAKGRFSWDDVGSWASVENHFPKDAGGNTVIGDLEAMDSSGNVVVSRERLTALIGVRDLVVVNAPGATLVCHKSRVQDVRALVRKLESSGRRKGVL